MGSQRKTWGASSNSRGSSSIQTSIQNPYIVPLPFKTLTLAMADSDNEVQSRTEKRRKKKRLHVEMSAVTDTPDRIAPVIGYFSSGYNPCDSEQPPEVRVFRNKHHRSSRLDLVVRPQGSNVEFVGKSYEGEAAVHQPCHYALGVLDKDSQTLKVVPIVANKVKEFIFFCFF